MSVVFQYFVKTSQIWLLIWHRLLWSENHLIIFLEPLDFHWSVKWLKERHITPCYLVMYPWQLTILTFLLTFLAKRCIICVAISKLIIKDTYHSSAVCFQTYRYPTKLEISIPPTECEAHPIITVQH